jgi:toxin YoeB
MMENENITYAIEFEEKAIKEIKALKKSEKQAYSKLIKILEELIYHPTTGLGKPELLKHNYAGFYSRRISQKHRIIYSINDREISVNVISVKGHYSDK